MTAHATGPFVVKLTPQPAEPDIDGGVARMALDKTFHGDLDATSKGTMLSAMTDVKGSAGYVALERVTGSLAGRRGSFVLQHSGTMDRGTPTLTISVVPDSGTDELVGLSGTMAIVIARGTHNYGFDYELPGH